MFRSILVIVCVYLAGCGDHACFSTKDDNRSIFDQEWCFETMPSCQRARGNFISSHGVERTTPCDYKKDKVFK